MSIVIGCDSFLALRNVRNGDLGRRLENLQVWVDPKQLEGSERAAPPGAVVQPLVDFDYLSDPWLGELIPPAYEARKAYYDGWTLWNERIGSIGRSRQGNALRRGLSMAAAGVRWARGWCRGAAGAAVRGRRAVAQALQKHSLAEEYARRFAEIDCEAVAAFSPEGMREMLLIESANRVNVPTAVMIRSRDNLSAKIQHLPFAGLYFVWSEATRRFFLRMYPEIDPARVLVTGSPQFDHHLEPAYRLEKTELFSLIGLDPRRPLVVYTMATPGLIEHEIDIAQHLADAAHAGTLSRGAQLLVRGHPRMFGSDVKLLHREWPEAKFYPRPTNASYNSAAHEGDVVRLILEDEPVHLATIFHQDVQVNVCGTMTIDSAILDKPVVNVYYDLVPDVPFAHSVRRFYERTDIREMMAYKASALAKTPSHCIELINHYLANPKQDAEGRRRAREEDCGPLDGQAGTRIATALEQISRARQTSGNAVSR